MNTAADLNLTGEDVWVSGHVRTPYVFGAIKDELSRVRAEVDTPQR